MRLEVNIGDDEACLEPEVVAAYAAGRLDERELGLVSEHIHGCEACRRLASHAAQLALSGVTTLAETADDDTASGSRVLASGTKVSRYVVERPLGAGGMGVVYLASDPELRRKVALKVLRDHLVTADLDAADLVRREAMAMARVAHPNVVGIHDLFREDDALYIVMELIEGTTLTRWLKESARSWEEIVEAARLAGEGLAAAHAEGIVHRDFKPDNVLVASSGRVCVSDFGLSRVRESIEDEGVASGRAMVRAGTPRYMSPEQLAGEQVTTKSDQYSFCVTLYQALYSELPSPGAAPPASSRAPRWLSRCLQRGLEADPAARYPTMRELLFALDRRPRQRARQLQAALAALVVLVAVAVPLVLRSRAAQAVSCADVERSWAGVWDDARKEDVHRAFAATGAPFAEAAWRSAETALDRYMTWWSAMRVDVCEATRVRKTESSELADLRMACLDRRRREVGALTLALAHADTDMVRKAPPNLAEAAPLEACADGNALRAASPPTPDPAMRDRLNQVRTKIDESAGLRVAGKYDESFVEAEAAVGAAEISGYRPVLAEALYGRSIVQSMRSKYDESLRDGYAAIAAAEETRQDSLAALSWCRVLDVLGVRLGHLEQASSLLPIAEAAVLRAGDADQLRVLFLHVRATLYLRNGKVKLSQDDFKAVIARAPRVYGDDSPFLGSMEIALGMTLESGGDYVGARDRYTSGLATMRRAWTDEHPTVAHAYGLLASIDGQLGFYDEARQLGARSVAISEHLLGPDHPQTVETKNWLAETLTLQHDYEAALPLRREVLQAAERTNNSQLRGYQIELADNLLRLGGIDEANVLARSALTDIDAADTPDADRVEVFPVVGALLDAKALTATGLGYTERALRLVDVPDTGETDQRPFVLRVHGEALARRDRYADAITFFERAAHETETSLGARHPDVGLAVLDLGLARIQSNDRAQGVLDLTRGLDIIKSSQLRDPRLVAAAGQALALAQAPSSPSNTRQLANAAHSFFSVVPSSLKSFPKEL